MSQQQHPHQLADRPPSLDFSLGVDIDGDALIVTIAGELDMATGPILRDRVRSYDTVRHIVYELDQLTFIDCAGLKALRTALTDDPGDTEMSVRSASAVARRLFALVDVESILAD